MASYGCGSVLCAPSVNIHALVYIDPWPYGIAAAASPPGDGHQDEARDRCALAADVCHSGGGGGGVLDAVDSPGQRSQTTTSRKGFNQVMRYKVKNTTTATSLHSGDHFDSHCHMKVEVDLSVLSQNTFLQHIFALSASAHISRVPLEYSHLASKPLI